MNISEAQKGSSTKFFGTVRQKVSDGKPCFSPLLLRKLFGYRNFSETRHRRVPLRHFSTLWDENFSTENCDTHFLLLPFFHKVFWILENFWNTAQNGFHKNFFGTVKQTIFDGKSWYSPPPLLSINFLATGNFLKHSTEGSSTKCFGTVRTKMFDGKSCYSPPFYL